VVPRHVWQRLGLDSQAVPNMRDLQNWVPYMRVHTYVLCRKQNRHVDLRATDLCRVSSPCQPHSTMGNMQGEEDPRFVYFLVWVALTRQLGFRAILSENLPGQGKLIFELLLGDMHLVSHVVCDPVGFRWCTHRPRQFVILIERRYACQLLCHPTHALATYAEMLEAFAFEKLIGLLKRPCAFTYSSYLIADAAEIERALHWARKRPGVKERHNGQIATEVAQKLTVWAAADPPGGASTTASLQMSACAWRSTGQLWVLGGATIWGRSICNSCLPNLSLETLPH